MYYFYSSFIYLIYYPIYNSLKLIYPYYPYTNLIAYYLLSILLKHYLTIPKAPFPNNFPDSKTNSLSKSYFPFKLYNFLLILSIKENLSLEFSFIIFFEISIKVLFSKSNIFCLFYLIISILF